MAKFTMNGLIGTVLILGCMSAYVTSLQLEGLTTKRPRTTKYSRTTVSPDDAQAALPSASLTGAPAAPPAPPPAPVSSSALYRLNSGSGATCILLQTDALLSIKYTNKLNERVETDLFIPDAAKVSGDCRYEDTASMSLVFKGFKLIISFAKTPGGERWYVARVQLRYATDNRLLELAARARAGQDAELSTSARHPALLFPTPVGKSYVCNSETAIQLDNQDPDSDVDHTATLFLRDLRLQAFMYKAKNAFGPPFRCVAGGGLRDETAPIAVGATLSVAVLCTVTGYGIFRYLKVKKVQYDTME